MIGPCPPPLLSAAVALLDEIFIVPRNRWPSFAERFPTIYRDAISSRLYVDAENDVVRAALAVKFFTWIEPGRRTRGAMIGGVCTRPEWRGRGLMTRLMKYAENSLRAESVEILVLWTGIEPYYEKLGWRVHETSLFGRLDRAFDAAPVATKDIALEPGTILRLENLRAAGSPSRIARSPEEYAALPFPATRTFCRTVEEAGRVAAYCLAGEAGTTAIQYELGGDEKFWPALLDSLRSVRSEVLINDFEGSALSRLLAERVTRKDQSSTMWKILSQDLDPGAVDRIRIPFFDRI